MDDREYMRMAVELARNGTGHVCPNPLVGCVLVKDGVVIGEGWHAKYGDLHAERNALKNCRERGNDPAGASAYVTLEPCCHHGKQPPCTDALMEAGIARVIVGSGDPNPKVAGKGLSILRNAGIEVVEHVLEEECRMLNEPFFHYITTGLPLVVLKYAMTLDGKIACHTGASRWVTGEEARKHVHGLRNKYAAIMTGIGTVLADDPMLNCRIDNGRDPVRVIVDTSLRIPMSSAIVRTAGEIPTIIATASKDMERISALTEKGCRILDVPVKDGHVDLHALMQLLGKEQIDSVLLEGGAELSWSAVKNGIVDQVKAYTAPKLFGGAYAKTPVGGHGFDDPSEALQLEDLKVTPLGSDLLIEGNVIKQ